MKKIKILGDPNNKKFCSSDIIISNLNKAAKNLNIYSDDELKIVYDCIGNKHGYTPDAMIIVYEMIFPNFILQNINPLPVFGVSRDNLKFILESGYPANLSNYFPLGVDSNIWSYKERRKIKDKFILLGIGESNSRGGLEIVVQNFCEEFQNNNNIKLYLRDRSSDTIFKTWVQNQASKYNVEIIHDDRHLENFEEEKYIYDNVDAAICLNKTSTWNLRTIECMSSGVPLIVIPYAGPREYTTNRFSALHVEFNLEPFTQESIINLQNIGLKNYLFDPSLSSKQPYWSIPKNTSIKYMMREFFENNNLRESIGYFGSIEAQKFTWERSALNLQLIINEK